MQKDHFGCLSGVLQQLSKSAWLFIPSEWEVKTSISFMRGKQRAHARLTFVGMCL